MYAPNFLAYFNPREPWGCAAVLGVLGLGVGYVTLFIFSPAAAALILLLFVVAVFAFRPQIALVVLALTAFFHGLMIDFSGVPWAREIPGLDTVNAPLVDFVLILIVVALVIAWLLKLPAASAAKLRWRFPGAWPYGLFLLSAGVSALLVYDHDVASSWHAWLRPLLFVYLMYVLVPARLLTDHTRFLRLVKVWFGVGIGVAAYGLTSFFMGAPQGWYRAVPFPLWGVTPLGLNHNLLAEPLVAIIPLAFWLASYAVNKKMARWYRRGAVVMIVVALLTLSRAAWLALAVELAVFCYVHRREVRQWWSRLTPQYIVGIIGALIMLLGYMGYFLTSSVVSSSSSNRLEVTQVALTFAREAPWFGYGPGTFVDLFNSSYVYTVEYGAALDAHGFVQKILVEEGIFGVIFFVAFLVWVIRALAGRARENWFYESLLLMVVGAITFQLFNTSYLNSVMWVPVGVALAGINLKNKTKISMS